MKSPQRNVKNLDAPDRDDDVDWSTAGYQGFSELETARSYKSAPAATNVSAPTARATQCRGKWLMLGAMITAGCLVGAHQVWNAFFRYRALGTVVGKSMSVSAPEDGVVQSLHVKEGDKVRPGQVLMTLDYPAWQARMAQLSDEIRVAQADMRAEASRLKWQALRSENGGEKVVVDLHEKMAAMLAAQARLEELALALVQRMQALRRRQTVTDQEVEQARLAEREQRDKIDKLNELVAKLKQRAEDVTSTADDGRAQLESKQSRVTALTAELARLRERALAGEIRAPGAGVVVRRFHAPGERVARNEPLVAILDTDSVEVELYLPHRSAQFLSPGQEIDLEIEPGLKQVPLQVSRLGDQLESPPEQLQTFYRQHAKLLPVYLKPVNTSGQAQALRVGGIARLSYWTTPRAVRGHP